MTQASILDLADFAPQPAPAAGWWNRQRKIAAALLALAVAVLLAGAPLTAGIEALGWTAAPAARPTVRVSFDALQHIDELTVDDKAQIVVEGLAAQERNAAIPLSGLPVETAGRFALGGAAAGVYPTALKCLTQAVYYEAAVEPLQGRRAVAQVVLNRVKHPAYPNSVCGVVYQGSERRTGCQFSFTCDGSLLRGPMAGPWREAESVARAALAGYVEPAVGTATHYHADYVLPKWAFQLAKIEQLGRHIFYRFQGSSGRAGALSARYAGAERIPAINFDVLRERALATAEVLPAEVAVTGLTVAPHVTDRHAEADVGGRIDMTKGWRPSIPDPVAASAAYRAVLEETGQDKTAPVAAAAADKPAAAAKVAAAEPAGALLHK